MNDDTARRLAGFAKKRREAAQRVADGISAAERAKVDNTERFRRLHEDVIIPALDELAAELPANGVPARVLVEGDTVGIELSDVLTRELRPSALRFQYTSGESSMRMTEIRPGASGPYGQPIPLESVTTDRLRGLVAKWLDQPELVVGLG